MLKRLNCALIAVFGVPLGCAAAWAVLYTAAAALAIAQLPPWAQGPAAAWLLDIPQESDGSFAAVGGIPEGGYSGPESFACLLPPRYGYLTDPYGAPRGGGWVHHGIDYGTFHQPVEVRTPFGGQVVFAGWGGSYGSLVVIENAGRRVYLAHHSELWTAPGVVLSAGDPVGLSGDTGNSSGIHVHFEVRVWTGSAWAAVDPNAALLPGQTGPCDWYALANPLP